MNLPKILIVDDEPSIRTVLERTLRKEGYLLDTASGGEEAIEKTASTNYDLILLDLYMEPVGGLTVLDSAKAKDEEIVVIILTGHAELNSAVEALRLGAFDYLFKPTTPEIIRLRVKDGLQHRRKVLQSRKLLRQVDSLHSLLNEISEETPLVDDVNAHERFVHINGLLVDRYHRTVTLNNRLIELTTTEFDLLVTLVLASPEPVSAKELVHTVLGYEAEEFEARNQMKWHIHQLRKKIEADATQSRHIKTVRHRGYLWRS